MISIIMGVYNGEKTLSQAIDSIIKQTYSDWELIACDDCSTDQTYAILKKYEENDRRIHVIKNLKNCGLANSLNHCLKYVKGEFIARMDCDDLSTPDRFERQIKFLEHHTEFELVGTFMQEFDDTGRHNIIQYKEVPEKTDLPKRNPFAHATIVMRASAMRELNGYHVSKYTMRTEDVDLWYRFFEKGFRGANLPEPLYYVRVDEAAYKRRKLKYMLHASYIIWYGCDLIGLPKYYKLFCVKPILSWIMPQNLKQKLYKKLF